MNVAIKTIIPIISAALLPGSVADFPEGESIRKAIATNIKRTIITTTTNAFQIIEQLTQKT